MVIILAAFHRVLIDAGKTLMLIPPGTGAESILSQLRGAYYRSCLPGFFLVVHSFDFNRLLEEGLLSIEGGKVCGRANDGRLNGIFLQCCDTDSQPCALSLMLTSRDFECEG